MKNQSRFLASVAVATLVMSMSLSAVAADPTTSPGSTTAAPQSSAPITSTPISTPVLPSSTQSAVPATSPQSNSAQPNSSRPSSTAHKAEAKPQQALGETDLGIEILNAGEKQRLAFNKGTAELKIKITNNSTKTATGTFKFSLVNIKNRLTNEPLLMAGSRCSSETLAAQASVDCVVTVLVASDEEYEGTLETVFTQKTGETLTKTSAVTINVDSEKLGLSGCAAADRVEAIFQLPLKGNQFRPGTYYVGTGYGTVGTIDKPGQTLTGLIPIEIAAGNVVKSALDSIKVKVEGDKLHITLYPQQYGFVELDKFVPAGLQKFPADVNHVGMVLYAPTGVELVLPYLVETKLTACSANKPIDTPVVVPPVPPAPVAKAAVKIVKQKPVVQGKLPATGSDLDLSWFLIMSALTGAGVALVCRNRR